MEYASAANGQERPIIDLFATTFTASEGAEEGALIGGLAASLLETTPQRDIRVFTALDHKTVVGAAIFTRLTYAEDSRTVFILSPMAVATDRQGQGVGQALLTHALAALREAGVDIAITYGDPAFYGKVGFAPLDQAVAPAPLPLSQPHGWIGQSLTGAPLTPLRGACSCVEALDDPAVW
jgi:predicted N-acetyltransferase YhbS